MSQEMRTRLGRVLRELNMGILTPSAAYHKICEIFRGVGERG